jgi:hypothetical protein
VSLDPNKVPQPTADPAGDTDPGPRAVAPGPVDRDATTNSSAGAGLPCLVDLLAEATHHAQRIIDTLGRNYDPRSAPQDPWETDILLSMIVMRARAIQRECALVPTDHPGWSPGEAERPAPAAVADTAASESPDGGSTVGTAQASSVGP